MPDDERLKQRKTDFGKIMSKKYWNAFGRYAQARGGPIRK